MTAHLWQGHVKVDSECGNLFLQLRDRAQATLERERLACLQAEGIAHIL